MVRSLSMGPIVVVLALTGLAWGQPTGNPGGQHQPTITLQEPGKGEEKCRILKSWVLSDGSRAFQAQVLSSNELLTIVETGPRTQAKAEPGHSFQAAATRIYHWGKSTVSPDGAPLPPSDALSLAQPAATAPAAPPVVRNEPVRPAIAPRTTTSTAQQPTTPKTWPPAYSAGPGQSQNAPRSNGITQTQATVPIKVVSDPGLAANQNVPALRVIQEPQVGPPALAVLAGQTSVSGFPATTPCDCPTQVVDQPAPRQGLWARLFHPNDQGTPCDNPTQCVQAAPAGTCCSTVAQGSTAIQVAQAPIAPPAPVDLGKTTTTVIQPAAPAPSIMPMPSTTEQRPDTASSIPVAVPPAPVAIPPAPTPVAQVQAPTTNLAPALTPTPISLLPLAIVTSVTPAPSLLPLATVSAVDLPAKPVPQANVHPQAPDTAGVAPPIKMPLSDNSKPDPLSDLGTYVNVPGHEIGKNLTPPQVAPPPITAVGPGPQPAPVPGQPAPGAPSAPPTGQPGKLPPPGSINSSMSVPLGRGSVVAAQAAAIQVNAELNTTVKGKGPQGSMVQVSAMEGNAFGPPPGQRPAEDPRANAWAPPTQLAQANPGLPPQPPMGQAPGMVPMMPYPGQPMMPYPGQPMMPYPGQPMMPYPGRPMMPYPGQPMMPVPAPGQPMMPFAGQPMMPAPGPGQPMMVPAMPYPGMPGPSMCEVPCPKPCAERCPIPCGYENAFTKAGNPRPIPSDMGQDPSNTCNAFQSICGTLAVPPGPTCCCPPGGACYPMGPGMPMGPVGPPLQSGMMPPVMPYAYLPMAPGGPIMAANPALAPVRVTPQQLAAAPPLTLANSGIQQVGAQTVVGGAPLGLPETLSLPEIVAVLNDSLFSSQREWAADRLTRFDWRVHPQVVECLLLSAQNDPALQVRLCCIHSLVRLKAGTTYVVKALQELKESDHDTKVRHEAEQALSTFLPGSATASDRPARK